MSTDGTLAIAKLIAVLSKIEGRKRLQKIVHLLGAHGHKEFNYRFVLHYYGPFSRRVALDLDFLNSAKLVKEEQRAEAYIYSATAEQAARITHFRGDDGQEPEWAGLATTFNELRIDFLEALSTYVFLYAAGHRGNKLKDFFRRIKSHLTSLFDEVAEFARTNSLLTAGTGT